MTDKVHRIIGHYVLDNPSGGPDRDGTSPGSLVVEQHSDGHWYDASLNCRIEAFEIAPTSSIPHYFSEPPPFDEQTEIYVVIEDEYFRTFVPKPGECERVGLPVRRLIN
jgi:hypothetical protein